MSNIRSPQSTMSSSLPPPASNPFSLPERLRRGDLMIVDSRRRNGLIIFKKYHAEFAGPGAAVGGNIDLDCEHVLPVGKLMLLEPSDHEERQKAYLIRRQWIRLTHQLTTHKVPLKRAKNSLNQFKTYFDGDTVAHIPDDAFAMLVGVLPQTIQMARSKKTKGRSKNGS